MRYKTTKKIKDLYEDKLWWMVEKRKVREICKTASNFIRVLKCVYIKLRANRSKIVHLYKEHTYTHIYWFIYIWTDSWKRKELRKLPRIRCVNDTQGEYLRLLKHTSPSTGSNIKLQHNKKIHSTFILSVELSAIK